MEDYLTRIWHEGRYISTTVVLTVRYALKKLSDLFSFELSRRLCLFYGIYFKRAFSFEVTSANFPILTHHD